MKDLTKCSYQVIFREIIVFVQVCNFFLDFSVSDTDNEDWEQDQESEQDSNESNERVIDVEDSDEEEGSDDADENDDNDDDDQDMDVGEPQTNGVDGSSSEDEEMDD